MAQTLTNALPFAPLQLLLLPPRFAQTSVSVDAQQPFECASIVQVEYRVYDRIQAGVNITQPGDEVLELVCGTTALAEWQDHVHQKEWQPADDKDAHDDAQGAGRPPLLGQRDLLLLLDELINGARLLLQRRGSSACACRRRLWWC